MDLYISDLISKYRVRPKRRIDLVSTLENVNRYCSSAFEQSTNSKATNDKVVKYFLYDHDSLQGWKLAPARRPMAGKVYIGPVQILSGLVKCPITSIQIMG